MQYKEINWYNLFWQMKLYLTLFKSIAQKLWNDNWANVERLDNKWEWFEVRLAFSSPFLFWLHLLFFLRLELTHSLLHQNIQNAGVLQKMMTLSQSNNATLATLHKFINLSMKLSLFKKSISILSLTASYHIFNCKTEPVFVKPPFLLPPEKKWIGRPQVPQCQLLWEHGDPTKVIIILYVFSDTTIYVSDFYVRWEPQHVWGQCTLCVLTLYLVAYVIWHPCLFLLK